PQDGLRRPARALVPRLAGEAPRGDAALAARRRARRPRRARRASAGRRAQARDRLAISALQFAHARVVVPDVDRRQAAGATARRVERMTDWLERIGACPRCRGALALESAQRAYACRGCGKLWPVVRGIPRFVESEHYVGSFGWEWRRHKRTQIDDAQS